jgi:hypothetical protein
VPRIEVLNEVQGRAPEVLLTEHVPAEVFTDEHYADQLFERMGWALVDAEHGIRQSEPDTRRRDPRGRRNREVMGAGGCDARRGGVAAAAGVRTRCGCDDGNDRRRTRCGRRDLVLVIRDLPGQTVIRAGKPCGAGCGPPVCLRFAS